ncbi:MAG: alpha/beta fold hydrolase [Anaerolineales bacterium]|nr:alpha/beta fold hydrolase [Anaerolineales bacterium]
MNNPLLLNPQLEGDAFYWEAGPTGVMLSHGFTATSAEVRPLAKHLLEKGYSVAGPLLAGHGSKPADLNRVRWQDWVAAGEESYQKLAARCQHVFVGGESMGGLVALHLAGQHPEAAGCLLYAPAIKLNLRPIDKLRLRLIAPFIESAPKGSVDGSNNWQGYTVNPLKGVGQLLNFQKAVLRLLPAVRRPVLLIQGRLDTTVHPSAGEIILSRVSSSLKEHHWMENSSHVILLDRELDQVVQITVRFMEKALGEKD